MSAISSVMRSIQQNFPYPTQISEKFSLSIPDIARNLNKVIFPMIGIVALSNLTGADAGPVTYGVCVSACLALANPILTPGCIISCIAVSGPWCP